MKKFLLSSFLLLTMTTFIGCSSSTKSNSPETSGSNSSEVEKLLKEYRKEGFLSANRYCVIIVKPADSNVSKSEVLKKARNRAFSSIQKYIMSRGKRILSSDKPALINIVNDNGELIEINDRANSRIVYVYEIKKTNLISTINRLGVK